MTRRVSIGVFDSGVGGLTVLKELVERMPDADYIYFGDTARLPYGSKSRETVTTFAVSSAKFLQERGAEMLVIACNTASALALEAIARGARVSVVGVIEPGAERAGAASHTRKAVVIGTEATISSHAYQRALEARGIIAREKACPLFVPLVEEGWIDHSVTEQVARIYLDDAFPTKANGADVLVLGCTHYPLLKPLLRRVVPPSVTIVDSAEATAHVVAERLRIAPLNASTGEERRKQPRLKFYATDSVERFRRLGERFLGQTIENVQLVDIGG
jgi:glutamate racemase